MNQKPSRTLRRGWTTGACATAAAKAAFKALITGDFTSSVSILLPKGEQPEFELFKTELGSDFSTVSIIKDAGDDPDVTHGAEISVTVRRGTPGTGIVFKAGTGVGTVTKAGLALEIGEPAINPVPRNLMRSIVSEIAEKQNHSRDVELTIAVTGGEELAKKTWNPRLGILGGISILGTTGVVIPYSCSAWIHSIQRGIDVARANGIQHVAGCTGSTSEKFVQNYYGLPDEALLDMGDFAGGLLKYFRKHPLPKLSIGGGFGKLSKLAQGQLDLHSGRSQVDFSMLAELLKKLGANQQLCEQAKSANTANEVLKLAQQAGLPLADTIAQKACQVVRKTLRKTETQLNILVINSQGELVGEAENNA
ncbi:MAG: cobalt-precorrin-5B (C(1))-methyltransferase [SAR324 cluster bacterium]|nr:cobalt-precorrin-5B (C(1))-methyltransferase [SAR324 cluster bacterium]MBL7034441.1 cobalt-precorrin-5B (C(1))-methyltransferase [SAR324 cluster bacterium]